MLEYLLKTKKWNPYCIRHSAITYDGDSLPEFALRKKVRWSMNSRQPARYMKTRMGNILKGQILAREGMTVGEELKAKPAVLVCQKCTYVNALENKICSKCDWPLNQKVLKEIDNQNLNEIQALRVQIRAIQEESERRFNHLVALVRKNPQLASVKPHVLRNLEIKRKG
jgi:hypothetical protein